MCVCNVRVAFEYERRAAAGAVRVMPRRASALLRAAVRGARVARAPTCTQLRGCVCGCAREAARRRRGGALYFNLRRAVSAVRVGALVESNSSLTAV